MNAATRIALALAATSSLAACSTVSIPNWGVLERGSLTRS
ncbi:hypothetical protein BH10PSE4_BH10PSE4_16490 [soil metagenome]